MWCHVIVFSWFWNICILGTISSYQHKREHIPITTIMENQTYIWHSKLKIVFRQYIPVKNMERFGTQINRLRDICGYLGKQTWPALEQVREVEGVEHKIFIDNYFSSPKRLQWSTPQENKCVQYSSSQQEGDATISVLNMCSCVQSRGKCKGCV
jgi:hypothetical protein